MRDSRRFGASRNRSDLKAIVRHCHHTRRCWSYRSIAAFIFITSLFQTVSQAQDHPDVPNPSDTLYVVELDDGALIVGRIKEVDAERIVVMLLDGGQEEVARTQISAIRLASRGRIVRGKFWNKDPGNTRLFFTSTGRALGAGEGYFGVYVIVLPFVAVGVTDNVTFTAGAPLLALLVGSIEPLYFGPKIQIIRTAEVQASVGTLTFYADKEFNGIAYGVSTFGSLDRSVTAGIGYGYAGRDFEREPVFMLGGEWRISSGQKMLTENYFFSGPTDPIFSIGIRDISRWGNGDIGLVARRVDGKICCFAPFFSVSVAFGR